MAERKLVYVVIKCRSDSTTTIKYGYKTTAEFDKSEIAKPLGIQAIGEDSGILGAIFGCNDPRPARATKKYSAVGSFSSYCADAKRASARKAGWSVSNPNYVNIRSTTLSKAVCISLAPAASAFKYAWRMSAKFYNKIATTPGLAALGISDVTAADLKEICVGVNNFKPGIATFAGDGFSYRTYADPTLTTIPEGWTISVPNWFTSV